MAKTHTVEIKTMAFPANTPVEKGDTVTWINRMPMNHTVTADNGAFDSGALGNNKSFSHVFQDAGVVAYHCKIHPNMKGKVTATAAAAAAAATHKIDITKMAFPASTAVAKGDTVVWTNQMSMNHTVTADDGSFDSGVLGKDKSFSQVFQNAGSVDYHCDIHPNMTGKIVVS